MPARILTSFLRQNLGPKHIGIQLYLDFRANVLNTKSRAQDFTSKIKLKSCALKVKVPDYEVNSCAYEVIMRYYLIQPREGEGCEIPDSYLATLLTFLARLITFLSILFTTLTILFTSLTRLLTSKY